MSHQLRSSFGLNVDLLIRHISEFDRIAASPACENDVKVSHVEERSHLVPRAVQRRLWKRNRDTPGSRPIADGEGVTRVEDLSDVLFVCGLGVLITTVDAAILSYHSA